MTGWGTSSLRRRRRGVSSVAPATPLAGSRPPARGAREYIWLPEAEIAPTFQSRAQVDRPVAVVDGVNTATPQTWYVATDHLHRPIRMTNAAKAVMWSATWTPWGAPHAITGAAVLNARFPGQWFQLESGLHYNWHRHYDPTLGRYTQPDPLGFVDGPSVYVYTRNRSPQAIDSRGLEIEATDPECAQDCEGMPDWLCKMVRGTQIHRDIADHMRRVYGNDIESRIDPLFGRGRPDLYNISTNRIYEIKPTSYGSGPRYSGARRQIERYSESSGRQYVPGSGIDLVPSSGMTIYSPSTGLDIDIMPDETGGTGLVFYKCRKPTRCQMR